MIKLAEHSIAQKPKHGTVYYTSACFHSHTITKIDTQQITLKLKKNKKSRIEWQQKHTRQENIQNAPTCPD